MFFKLKHYFEEFRLWIGNLEYINWITKCGINRLKNICNIKPYKDNVVTSSISFIYLLVLAYLHVLYSLNVFYLFYNGSLNVYHNKCLN